MKREITLIGLMIVFSVNGFSQMPNWAWSNESLGVNNESIQDICIDENGNTYSTGYIVGTAIFGNDTLNSHGSADIFIAKLGPNGNWLWAKNFGSPFGDGGIGIVSDSSGNIYVMGGFVDTIVFGMDTLSSNLVSHLFIAKADQSGNWIWARSVGGTSGCTGRAITIDSKGHLFMTGLFSGTAIFGSTSITTIGGAQGIFVSKMDTSGNWQWTRKAGGGNYWDEGSTITVDDFDNVIIGGKYNGGASPVYFGSIQLYSALCLYDTYIAKLDSAGTWLWARTIGWEGSCTEVYITGTDSLGNIFLSGNFYGGGTFDTVYFGSIIVASDKNFNTYVAKMSPLGIWQWVNKATGFAITSATKDSNENMYVFGYIRDTLTLDSIVIFQDTINHKYPIIKVDFLGNWLWTQLASGPQNIYPQSIASDFLGNIFVAGLYSQAINFGTYYMTHTGNDYNIFVAKLDAQAVGISESINPEFSLIVYPNPVEYELRIENEELRIEKVELYNTVGENIYCKQQTNNDKTQTVDVRQLLPGVYFIVVTDDKGYKVTSKFIKL